MLLCLVFLGNKKNNSVNSVEINNWNNHFLFVLSIHRLCRKHEVGAITLFSHCMPYTVGGGFVNPYKTINRKFKIFLAQGYNQG